MLEAPITADEALRLADLQSLGILDTPPEERFDRITQAAQRLFGVPIALVSLIDSERQWFKSHQGLCETETPRNISFCGHAIHADQPFVISNACEDVRFADNPLVTGDFHLRFYAGMALRSTNGRPLGTLCLIDRQPKTLTPPELLLLADLAAWAERELNLRELQVANDLAELCSRRLRVVLDSTADAVIAVDEQLVIHTLNRTAAQMFGLSEAEWLGQSLRRLLPDTAIDNVLRGLQELQREHTLHASLPPGLALTDQADTPFHADIRIGRTEIRGADCFTLIIRDVTAQRELDNMKSAFVATVSHELRTPITSIKGAIRLLSIGAGNMPAQQANLLEIADKNCARLSRMVDDILDLEKVDTGKLIVKPQRQALAPCIRQALAAMQPYAETLGVDTLFDSEDDDATLCLMDEGRITQVVVNLLSNAIKFSDRGARVWTRVERCDGQVRVSVTDHGRGIPDAFKDKVFQRFSQAEAPRAHELPGSGLGLAICKAIIEQHHGQIGFRSTPGLGSTFYFELPVEAEVEASLMSAH